MNCMNRPLVSETSPLLPVQQAPHDFDSPHVTPVVNALENADYTHLRWESLTPQSPPASLELDQCKRLAFAFIILLQLRRQKIAWDARNLDAYEQWTEEDAHTRDVETLEEKLSELWENFLAQYHGPRELYDVFWSPFPLVRGKTATIRVVDFLSSRDAPQKFVAHPMVSMTMARAWRFGRPDTHHSLSLGSNFFNTNASPSKQHFLDFIFDLAFLLLLLSYVIRPPNWPHSEDKPPAPTMTYSYTPREVCIVVYAFSVLASARALNVILSVLTLLAFALSLPSLPLPGGIPFYLLLLVIFSRVLIYHIPTILPSPLLLVTHQRSFPLAVLLCKGLLRIVGPLFRFYLPTVLTTFLALTISMSGPLTGPLMHVLSLYEIFLPPESVPPIVGAAPMDTRVALLILSVTVWLLILSSAYILGTSTPVADAESMIWSSSAAWDIYSQEIGYEARVASYLATVAYSADYLFPPPFNLIELLLVTIPVGLIRIFGVQVNRTILARPVWNITIRPLMMITNPLSAPFN